MTDDFVSDWARAIAAGAVVIKEPQAKPWGQTTGYLRDLDGFIVELCTRSPRDQPRSGTSPEPAPDGAR